jgi:hypothetical protein
VHAIVVVPPVNDIISSGEREVDAELVPGIQTTNAATSERTAAVRINARSIIFDHPLLFLVKARGLPQQDLRVRFHSIAVPEGHPSHASILLSVLLALYWRITLQVAH